MFINGIYEFLPAFNLGNDNVVRNNKYNLTMGILLKPESLRFWFAPE